MTKNIFTCNSPSAHYCKDSYLQNDVYSCVYTCKCVIEEHVQANISTVEFKNNNNNIAVFK